MSRCTTMELDPFPACEVCIYREEGCVIGAIGLGTRLHRYRRASHYAAHLSPQGNTHPKSDPAVLQMQGLMREVGDNNVQLRQSLAEEQRSVEELKQKLAANENQLE